ncbi:MAG: hypothetical protein ACFFDI_13410 [Promethearchaeota archaeon]
MSAEYKKDERDGELKILEINARLWLHFWLSICEVDIIFHSYLDAIGKKMGIMRPEYKTGAKMSFPEMKSRLQLKCYEGELSPSESVQSLQGEIHFTLFDKTDALPLIMNYAVRISTSIKHFSN